MNANKKNKIPGVLCARDFLLYRKLISCKILCIAQRVAGHGANSNDFNIETRQVPECT